MPLLTPENLPEVLIGVAGIITAIGGITWWKVRNEPPKPGTSDAATLALAENTRATLAMVEAMKGQNTHFAENNEMFKALGPMLSDMRHDGAEAKAHLASIRDALNRRG